MSAVANQHIDGSCTIGRDIAVGGNARVRGSAVIGHDLKVEGYLDAPNIKGFLRGMFRTAAELEESCAAPEEGWAALVGTSLPAEIYVYHDGEWIASGGTGGEVTADYTQCRQEHEEQAARLQTFIGTKGNAGGLAPLDAAAQVPEWHMPPGVFDVVGFNGFVDADDVSVSDTPAGAKFGKVVCCAQRFVYIPTNITGQDVVTAHTSWKRMYSESSGAVIQIHEVDDSARYGSPGILGVTPVRGKLYIDLTTTTPYLYDGLELVAMPTVPRVAESISAAVSRGEAGGTAPLNPDAQIPEWALPPRAFQVLPFAGFSDGGEYELILPDGDASSSYQGILFHDGHFVAQPGRSYTETGKLYTRWTVTYKESVPGSAAVRRRTVDASLRYGIPTARGVEPSTSKIYIDTSTRTAYIYDGDGGLIPISTPPSLARVTDTE